MSEDEVAIHRERVDLYIHADKPITINLVVKHEADPAVRATIRVKEADMPASMTVDTHNEVISLQFVDDFGNVTNAPANAAVVYSSDNPAVATVDPTTGAITPVGATGTFNAGATLTDSSTGGQLMEADGVTPFPDVAPVAVQVDAGAAVGDRLSVDASAPPPPAPTPPTPPAPSGP